MLEPDKDTSCPDCVRNHTPDMPCPRRLAKSLLTGDVSNLTDADRLSGRATLPHQQVEDMVEDWLADNLAM